MMTLALADAVCQCPTGLWFFFFFNYFLPGMLILGIVMFTWVTFFDNPPC